MVVLSPKRFGMPAMDENRLIDIETKMAHQEQLLSELNDALTDQQAQISRLESLCQSLIDRLKSLGERADPSGDERPPHY
jgi:SlyX protein